MLHSEAASQSRKDVAISRAFPGDCFTTFAMTTLALPHETVVAQPLRPYGRFEEEAASEETTRPGNELTHP